MKPIDLHLLNAEAKFKEAINHAFDLGWEASEERIIKLLEADLLRFMYWDDDSSYAKGINITGFIALIKGEK